MLKKAYSFVLASLKTSTYRKGTPRSLASCGRAVSHFEHPALFVKNKVSITYYAYPSSFIG
jgi:hypothetical protein